MPHTPLIDDGSDAWPLGQITKAAASVVGDQRRPPPVKEFRPLRPRNVAGARFA